MTRGIYADPKAEWAVHLWPVRPADGSQPVLKLTVLNGVNCRYGFALDDVGNEITWPLGSEHLGWKHHWVGRG